MKEKKSLKSFNISEVKLPKNLPDIAKNVSGQRKYKIEENYKSVYDFLGILFHFRFIEKLEISEIAEILGTQVEPLHINLYNFRWHYSKDYEQNNKEYKVEKEKLLKIFNEAKKKALKLDIESHVKIKKAIEECKNIRKSSYTKLNFESLEEYVKTFYQLIFIDGLTSLQISILFDLSYSDVHYRLPKLGFNVTHGEGIIKKLKNKRHNYEKTERAKKVTIIKSQIKHASTGSKNENFARTLLANFLYDYFDSKDFDIVVGINNTGILFSKEIDIPIIIHSRENNKLFKFAVEYNGEVFHKNDEEKIELAEKRGWIYLPITEKKNIRASNNSDIIEKLVRGTCENIKAYVENHN